MPINRELRWFYPIDWPEISRRVRFERAGGVCEGCGRPHGETVRCLPDGRWFDSCAPHLAQRPGPASAMAGYRGGGGVPADPRHPGGGASRS